MGLLDQNIKNYIIKPRGNIIPKFGIKDKNSNKLGLVKGGIISNKFSLFDSDESLLLTVNKKKFSWKRETYEVKNPNGRHWKIKTKRWTKTFI